MDTNLSLSLKMECTLFFQENPYTLETVEGVALRLGRRAEDIEPILQMLVQSMILEKIGEGINAIYRYVQPETIQGTDLYG